MPTVIDTNPFPLGAIKPTPGTPLSILANYPDLDVDLYSCNLILCQALPGNTGHCFLGNSRLNKTTGEGVFFNFLWPGDAFVLSNFYQNTYRLSDFMVDTDTLGDGLNVSIYIR